MKNLFIIDASGFLFRSYYAIRQMTNSKGESTNAIFGYIRSIFKLMKDFEPTHLVSIFDGPKSWQSRLDIYPEYKANRLEPPPDLSHQFDWAQEFCQIMEIPFLSVPKVEADDTIASVALWAANHANAHVYICSSDKDLCQFVGPKISILHTHKDNLILGPEEVENSFGIPPHLIGDYLAIIGDASDNVPGLPGFGPKTATQLLKQYGSLENIFAHVSDFTGKKKETLSTYQDQAKMSRQLVEINTRIPFPHEEKFFRLGTPKIDQVKEFFLDKDFRSLVKEVEQKYNPNHLNNEKEEVSYTLVDNEQELDSLVKTLSKKEEISVDTETTGTRPLEAELVGIGFCVEKGKAWYVPCNGTLGRDKVLEKLKPLLENPHIGFYGHNIKYDFHIFQNYQITIKNISFDTILASYVLSAHKRQHSLDALSLEYFGKVKTAITDLIGKGKNQLSMWDIPIQTVCNYCCEDVDYTLRLKKELSKQLEERNLSHILFDIELPLLKVLALMERKGIFIDVPYLKRFSKELTENIQKVAENIYKEVGQEFNLNSPKQLGEVLHNTFNIGLPKTKTGFSTSADVLESIKHDYPIVEHILNYRSMEKLRSTYIDALPETVNPATNRIHCDFNQSVTATGRLSSQNPNLQNIPVRTELGLKIREAFKPEDPNSSYLSADYSQIELRLMAHMSEDPELIKAFEHGEDIHKYTASRLWDVPIDEVSSEMRFHAKAVNFGIMYGQGEHGLSQQLGISRKEAKAFIGKYFEKYWKVKEFIDSCIEKAKNTGKAVTMTGRERILPEINSKNFMLRAQAERLAVNTPLQGTQADLIKLAMLRIQQVFKEMNYPPLMILQIHDELLFEVPDTEIETVTPLIRKSMENVWELKIPLIVDIAVGKNWKKC